MKTNKLKRIKAASPAQPKTPLDTRAPAPKPAAIKSSGASAPVPGGQAIAVTARIDVGLGNVLFIRGQGNGLSWDKGTPLVCENASTWTWSTPQASDKMVFKLLLNDQVWALGHDILAEAGNRIDITPSF